MIWISQIEQIPVWCSVISVSCQLPMWTSLNKYIKANSPLVRERKRSPGYTGLTLLVFVHLRLSAHQLCLTTSGFFTFEPEEGYSVIQVIFYWLVSSQLKFTERRGAENLRIFFRAREYILSYTFFIFMSECNTCWKWTIKRDQETSHARFSQLVQNWQKWQYWLQMI